MATGLIYRMLGIVLFMAIASSANAHGTAAHAKKKAVIEKDQVAWGIAGDVADATRTINISMTDAMRFEPASIQAKQGETIRFMIKNNGKLMHEFVLGTPAALEEHAAMMVKFPKMEHEEPYMAHVASGKTGEIVWKFNRAGAFNFACLIPGHYQAGMIGTMGVGK